MTICTLETIINVFRIGNRQLVAGCRFGPVFLNRQLNRQLVSESLSGGREGFGPIRIGAGLYIVK